MLDHRTFKGDWLENPVGTGPFELEEWTTNERAVLKARDDYWINGADGKPLPYLDELRFIWLGDNATSSTYVSAMKGGQIDILYPNVETVQAMQGDPDFTINAIPTTQTDVLRMRVDLEPWTDNRVRTALKLCQDKEKIIKLAYFGEAIPGPDCHASPVHPEFSPMEDTPYDTEKAKALLAEAGYPDGLDVNLVVSAGDFQESYATILKEDAEPAGLRINIETIPGSSYWDVWTEIDLGITSWTHRPLAVMVLPLAYVCDKEGTPVPWNETRWCDEEFDTLLTQAMGTLDVNERKKIMADIQRIQVERGSIGIPWWKNAWIAYVNKVKGPKAHPTNYNFSFSETWIDEEA
jgi:peptide/nickel transport system substrate-binding protein